MAEAYDCLSSLRMVLHKRREELKEKVARGVSEGTYPEMVGRCKELADTLDKINQQIRSINGGDDESSADA